MNVKHTAAVNRVLRNASRDLRGDNALLLARAEQTLLRNRRLLREIRAALAQARP